MTEIYPSTPLPGYAYEVLEKYNVLIDEYDSGAEQRRKIIRFPKRTFSLIYKYLSATDRNTIQNFFSNRGGPYESFWFIDLKSRKWVDEYVGRGIWYSMGGALADDGGVKTTETTASNNSTANDMTLLPAVPVADDAYYFGASDIFDLLRINIGTAGAGTWAIAWEYWDGDSWEAVSGLSDGTSGFTVSGTQDVKFTLPSNWALKTESSLNLYWLRARVSSYTSITTQPKGTQSWTQLRTYDLHGKTTSSLTVYINGVAKTGGGTDYTFITGGGEASVDRIRFTNVLTSGDLITSDFEGYLRIKGRFKENSLAETMETYNFFSMKVDIHEVQW